MKTIFKYFFVSLILMDICIIPFHYVEKNYYDITFAVIGILFLSLALYRMRKQS